MENCCLLRKLNSCSSLRKSKIRLFRDNPRFKSFKLLKIGNWVELQEFNFFIILHKLLIFCIVLCLSFWDTFMLRHSYISRIKLWMMKQVFQRQIVKLSPNWNQTKLLKLEPEKKQMRGWDFSWFEFSKIIARKAIQKGPKRQSFDFKRPIFCHFASIRA